MNETIHKTDTDTRITGHIDYVIHGVFRNHLKHAIDNTDFTGLRRYSDCDRKAKAIHSQFPSYDIHYGAVYVLNVPGNGVYQYIYNPPLEYHAWLQKNDIIIDPGLYGMIESGLMIKDDMGSLLEGRTPFMLAGQPPEFMHYESNKVFAYGIY